MARTTKKIAENVTGAIKPPITFKEFSKDPVKGLMFICIVAVGYLYVDIKMSNASIVSKQDTKIERLETKLDTLQLQIINLVGEASAKDAKLEMINSLNNLPK